MDQQLAQQMAADLRDLKVLVGRMADCLNRISGTPSALRDGSRLNGRGPTRRVHRRAPKRDLIYQLLGQPDEGFSSFELVDLAEQIGQPLKSSTITSVLSTEARAGRLEYVDGRYRLPPTAAEEAAGA